ncbi:MAG TPA: hypothetical protein DCK79_06545 [Candidatus Atribacteria bacterium]|nr:hypothetical protein [Candidatus Atribacteria bacterium]
MLKERGECLVLVFIGLSFLLLLTGEANAQMGMNVSPLMIYKEVSVNNNIISTTVTNLERYPLEITTSLAGLSHNLEGKIEILENEEEIEKAIKIFNLAPSDRKFTLAPGEKRKINLKVNILKAQNIKPSGAAYGVLFFSSQPLENKNKTLLNVTRVGVAILITLPGGKIKKGEITQVYLTQVKAGDEIVYVLKLKNRGNVHFTPLTGEVVIKNNKGKEEGRFFIQPRICLPERECYLKAKWEGHNLLPGEYTACGVVEIEKGKEIKVRDIHFTIVKPYVLVQPAGELSDLENIKVVQKEPINFNFTFINMGNIDLNPCINLLVREEGSKSKLIRELSWQDEKVKVGERKDYSIITKGLPVGNYNVVIKAEYSKPEYGGTKVAMAEALLEVIEKELVIEGEITDFSIEVTETENRIISKISFKNTGNTEFSVEGLIELKNNQGRVVGQIPVNKTSILAGKEKRIKELWKGNLPVGLYKAVVTLIYGEGKMATGETLFLVK